MFVIMVAAMVIVSCEPIEDRLEMKGAVTEADINQYVSVTTEMRNGVSSNFLILKSDGLKALTSFQHGLGTYVGTNGRVQGYVVPGAQDVILTVLNPDGTKITKTYTVNVQECFEVESEWALFCGTGSKTWTWDDSVDDPYGMGDAFDWAPNWWQAPIDDAEGKGASMTFSALGATFTKTKTNGSKESGSFAFDMNKTFPSYSSVSKGQLTTTIPVLFGKTTGDDTGIGSDGKDVRVYEIAKLNNDELVLVWVEADMRPDSEGWGQATWWLFKAK
jgi:hypothetical protein